MKDALVISSESMKTGIKAFDAAHIACAILTDCDFFISTDKRLLKYKFVKMWEKMAWERMQQQTTL
jgi:predicted nucleic acid-binding protein